jgi:hypothetical protein
MVRDGVVWVDTELAGRISAAELDGLRAGLMALTDIREELELRQRLGWSDPTNDR